MHIDVSKLLLILLYFGSHCRARAKSGVKVLGATATSDQWNVSFESENTKQTVARVTVSRKDQDTETTPSPVDMDENE